MCRGHASFVFQQLNQLGWKVADEKGILKDTPEDHEYLIQVLASSHGQRLLKHLPDEKLLYDRLDRIIKQPGGRRLVRDLLRLPDGYRYAQAKRPSGVPAMHSFLPKTSQGKVQTIRDYDKPTGRIYTLEQFIARLHQSHDQEPAKSTN
jgi:hypothetical protein